MNNNVSEYNAGVIIQFRSLSADCCSNDRHKKKTKKVTAVSSFNWKTKKIFIGSFLVEVFRLLQRQVLPEVHPPPTTKVTSKTLSHWLWCLAKRHKIYGTTNASAPKDGLKARERIKNKKRKLNRDTIKSYRETLFRSTFKVGFVGDLIKPPLLQMKVTSRKNVGCVIHPGGYNLTRPVKYTPGRDSAVRKKTKKKGGTIQSDYIDGSIV